MARTKTFVELNKTINIIETIDNQVLIELLDYTLSGSSSLKLITKYRAMYFDDVVNMYKNDLLEV